MKVFTMKAFDHCITSYVTVGTFLRRHATLCLFVVGTALLIGGLSQISYSQGETGDLSLSEANFDDTLIRNAVGNLFALIEGAFGALVMVVAGLGAIVAAAMGAYRAALGMLVVAIGAFILRALVSLFFGTNFVDRNAAGSRGF